MKKTIKIFLAIGIILSAVLAPFLCAVYFQSGDVVSGVFFLINAIDDIIIGSIALTILEKAKNKKELTAIGVVSIIFANPVAGILMLCMRDEHLVESNNNFSQTNQAESSPEETTGSLEQPRETVEENAPEDKECENKITQPSVDARKIAREQAFERLDDLKLMKERGLITEEEY